MPDPFLIILGGIAVLTIILVTVVVFLRTRPRRLATALDRPGRRGPPWSALAMLILLLVGLGAGYVGVTSLVVNSATPNGTGIVLPTLSDTDIARLRPSPTLLPTSLSSQVTDSLSPILPSISPTSPTTVPVSSFETTSLPPSTVGPSSSAISSLPSPLTKATPATPRPSSFGESALVIAADETRIAAMPDIFDRFGAQTYDALGRGVLIVAWTASGDFKKKLAFEREWVAANRGVMCLSSAWTTYTSALDIYTTIGELFDAAISAGTISSNDTTRMASLSKSARDQVTRTTRILSDPLVIRACAK